MKFPILPLLFACSALTASALIPPGSADKNTSEGWQAIGFPVDDYAPWSLSLQAKEIATKDKQYLVVAGYLIVFGNSIILFPDKDASRSGGVSGALILSREDSPALRWLFGANAAEGFYAVGGVLSVTPKGPQLGHFTKIRFAMKVEPIRELNEVKRQDAR